MASTNEKGPPPIGSHSYHEQAAGMLDNAQSGLGPLNADGTPMALAAEPAPDGTKTPPGFKRTPVQATGLFPGETAKKSGGLGDKLLGLFPEWLQDAMRTRRAWKDWVRSMVVVFVQMILLVVRPSSKALGSGAFFGVLATQMIPPTLATPIFFLTIVTVGLGLLFGWAWSAAAMAVANSVRNQAKIKATMDRILSTATGDPKLAVSTAMMSHAAFLDPGASAVYGAFMFIGQYALGWVRATQPKMMYLASFATVIIDVGISTGGLMPMNNFMTPTSVMPSAAAYMAVGLVATMLIFPETISHHVLKLHCTAQLRGTYAILAMQNEVVHTRLQDHDAWTNLANQTAAKRDQVIGAQSEVMSQGKMLPLEISHSRLGPVQLQKILKAGRELGARAFAMGSFAMGTATRHRDWKEWKAHPSLESGPGVKGELAHVRERRQARGESLGELMPQVALVSQRLRESAELVLRSEIQWLETVNKYRWKKIPSDFPGIEARNAALHELEDALDEFRRSDQLKILEPYRDMFDEDGRLKTSEAPHVSADLQPLFQVFVFTATLTSFCDTLVDWARLVLRTEAENPENRFWWAGKGRFLSSLWDTSQTDTSGENNFRFGVDDPLADDGKSVDTHGDLGVFDDDKRELRSYEKRDKRDRGRWRKDPDARTPVNAFQWFNRGVMKLIHLAISGNGVFAARYSILSIALWIPAVCPHSAAFYHLNSGSWALIMAQTGLSLTAGEQVASFLLLVGGSVLGIVSGMVAWYIGAPGNGDGNAYGITAATLVVLAPWLFMRLNAPAQQAGLWQFFTVTLVFIITFSWINNKGAPVGVAQGKGASLAAKRAVLVLIGCAAAFIMGLLPWPIGAKVLLRQGLSKNIASISELYALEISAYGTERADESEIERKVRRERFRYHFFEIVSRLDDIRSRIGATKLEPDMLGPWPKEEYMNMVHSQMMILGASSVLSCTYARMNLKYSNLLMSLGGIMEPMFISDCLSLFTILRHSLRNGSPVPPIVPIFERLIYHRKSKVAGLLVQQELQLEDEDGTADGAGTTTSAEKAGETGSRSHSTTGSDTLTNAEDRLVDLIAPYFTWQNIHDEQFVLFAASLVSLLETINGLNQMHVEVVNLVGVQKLQGWEHLQEKWAQLGRDV